MPESKRDINLQKGARVINAAIAEMELPDEVKLSAQHVVTMFATDLLPGLWPRRPDAGPPEPGAADEVNRGRGSSEDRGAAPGEDEALDALRRQLRTLVSDDDDDNACPEPVSAASRAASQRSAFDAEVKEAPPPRRAAHETIPRPWEDREHRLVEAALVTLQYAYKTRLSQLEGSILDAMKRGADPLDVLDALLAATDRHNDEPTLAALRALSTRRDLH